MLAEKYVRAGERRMARQAVAPGLDGSGRATTPLCRGMMGGCAVANGLLDRGEHLRGPPPSPDVFDAVLADQQE